MAVSEATDGREALRLVHQQHPALVVLDVTMPDIDGWQTLAAHPRRHATSR